MDSKYLEEVKAREQAATPGKWKVVCRGNTIQSLQVVTETYWERPKQISICSSINPKREADADFISYSRTDIPALIAEVERLTEEQTVSKMEIATLKKALELMATYLVHFGRIDEMLCDDIPQPIHLKYQPKNDGNYKNEPCIQCVQEYFIKKCRRGRNESSLR